MPRPVPLVIAAAVVATPLLASAQSAREREARPVWYDEGPMRWTGGPTSADITANDLRTRLYAFAHDSMAGRRAGEPGNHKGTAYIAAEFARLGLRPAGDSGGYFQNLPFGPIGYDVATLRLAVERSALALRIEWIPIPPTLGGGVGGSLRANGVETVFAGRWGDSTALDPARFRGKVAVFVGTPNAPGFDLLRPPPLLPRCDSVPDKFGAAAAARVEAEQRSRPAAAPPTPRGPAPAVVARDNRAQAAGAVGILIIGSDTLPAPMVALSLASRMTMKPAALPAGSGLGGAAISRSAAARLFSKPLETIAIGTAGSRITAAWTYGWRESATPARNVIAVLPGSDPARAHEYVLVGAHNDHVGTGPAVEHDSLRAVNTVTRRQGANDPACRPTEAQQQRIDSLIAHARAIRPPRRDSIFNGADDDGSGTVVMLEIAERFAAEKPARSMLFISHQGEEAGLLGSRWFVNHPTVPLANIVAAHNMDMVGKGRVEQVKFGGPTSVQMLGARRLSREFGDIIDSVNAVREETMAIDKTWEVRANPLNRFCRSDQVSYVLKDIPVTYFSLGYAPDYHQLTDEPQYIDYEHSARLGRFIHDVMWAISERGDRPVVAGPDPDFPNCR